MSWRESVLNFLRVPPTPAPPPGSPPRVFRAAPNFFYLRLLRWGAMQLPAIVGLIVAIFFVRQFAEPRLPPFVVWLIAAGEIVGIVVLATEISLGWMIVRLDYELRWYMLSDRALRIREGITTVREKTVALANIQNIAVRQGPLQRLLGIADVEVKTAGGGGKSSEMDSKGHRGEPMHVAYFRGVDNAEEIRDLLRDAVKRQRDSGLGDPDEPQALDTESAAADLLRAARELRASFDLRKTSARGAVPPPA